AIAFAAGTARAEQAVFDSSRCSAGPEDEIAIAAGDVAFSIPAAALIYVLTIPSSDATAAGALGQDTPQEGCPHNPVTGSAFTLRMRELLADFYPAPWGSPPTGMVTIIWNPDANTRFERMLGRNYSRLCGLEQ